MGWSDVTLSSGLAYTCGNEPSVLQGLPATHQPAGVFQGDLRLGPSLTCRGLWADVSVLDHSTGMLKGVMGQEVTPALSDRDLRSVLCLV